MDGSVRAEEKGDHHGRTRACWMPQYPPQEDSVHAADVHSPEGFGRPGERTADAEVVDPCDAHRRAGCGAIALPRHEAVDESLRGRVNLFWHVASNAARTSVQFSPPGIIHQ